jgi:cytochrome c oxidase cbb3-type subunit I/II
MYPDFIATVVRIVPLYWVRAAGGGLFLLSFVLMLYNVVRTIRGAKAPEPDAPVVKHRERFDDGLREKPHRRLEGLPLVFTVLSVGAILVGTIIEILPALTMHEYASLQGKGAPYTPLEVAGRDLYIREGCYGCHSQMVRPTVPESLRYGKPSTPGDGAWDHPFQWGSKRTGPDLARVGGKYPDMWHLRHMDDPRLMTPNSTMPAYPWMLRNRTDFDGLPRRLAVLRQTGVPYTPDQVQGAAALAREQARKVSETLASQGGPRNLEDKEVVALIAYLQRLGKGAAK